jgi:hypothetical protein
LELWWPIRARCGFLARHNSKIGALEELIKGEMIMVIMG